MKRLLLIALTFQMLFVLPGAVSADPAPGHRTFKGLPPEVEKLVLTSMRDARVLLTAPPELKRFEEGNLDVRAIWVNNKSSTSISLGKAVLTFVKQGANGGSESFDIVMQAQANRAALSVRHSRGALIHFNTDYQELPDRRYHWIHGPAGMGMFVLFPQTSRSEEARSLMLCPRDLGGRGARTENLLGETGYQLTRASFGFRGISRTSLTTGSDIGLARIALFTSPLVPAGRPFDDRSYSANPAADLQYLPDEEEVLPPPQDPASITGALAFEQELQAPAGQKRTLTTTNYAWIKRVPFDTQLTVEMEEGGTKYRVTSGPGACYLMVFDWIEETRRYTKEELRVPEWLKDGS